MEFHIDKTKNWDKKDFYSVYSEDVNKFKIIDGHKDLILEVVAFIKKQIKDLEYDDGLDYFCKETSSIRTSGKTSGQIVIVRPVQAGGLAEGSSKGPRTTSAIEINKVTDDLFKRITSNLKTHIKTGQKENDELPNLVSLFYEL